MSKKSTQKIKHPTNYARGFRLKRLAIAAAVSLMVTTTGQAGEQSNKTLVVATATHSTMTIQEHSASFCGMDGTIDNTKKGYSGVGYANTDKAKGAEISWYVKSDAQQQYNIEWKYANGGKTNRSATLYINGKKSKKINFNGTDSWTQWKNSIAVTVSLNKGDNAIKLAANTTDGLPNIDAMQIESGPLAEGDCLQQYQDKADLPNKAVITGDKPTIWYASDSTVRHYKKSASNQQGVGQRLPEFLIKDVSIANYAKGGRAITSFKSDGFWGDIISNVRSGDVILIQFGINDRGDVPDIEVFKEYLRQYVKDARAKNAVPVFVTPTPRNQHKNGVYTNAFTKYCDAKAEVAKELNVTLLDLQTKGREFYTEIGVNEVTNVMMKDALHLLKPGAYHMARLLAESIAESPLYPLRNKVITENLEVDRKPEVDGWKPRAVYTHN